MRAMRASTGMCCGRLLPCRSDPVRCSGKRADVAMNGFGDPDRERGRKVVFPRELCI
jgi:hypothetical protein